MRKSKNWGGARPGSGRNRQRLTLKLEAAKSLYLLTKHRRALLSKPELTEEDVVSELVGQEWKNVEASYQDGTQPAEKFII